jgi:transposase InsO family protein
MPGSFSMRSNRRFMNGARPRAWGWSTIRIADRNTCPSNTPNDWPKRGIESSVGSVGDSYDNALAETINGLFKAEVIHRRGPWCSFEPVEYATLKWVDCFNNSCIFEPIGNIPPAEAEANFYATLETEPMAA